MLTDKNMNSLTVIVLIFHIFYRYLNTLNCEIKNCHFQQNVVAKITNFVKF